jgi:hypothetical protein
MPKIKMTEEQARDALAENPLPQTPWVTVEADGIAINTGFSEALLRILRWVPRAEWRPDKRRWHVPFAGANAIRSVLPEITRLADAAQELDETQTAERRLAHEASGDAPRTSEAHDRLAGAARLLYGAEWTAPFARDAKLDPAFVAGWVNGSVPIDASYGAFKDLVLLMRARASEITAAAEGLEAWLATAAAKSHDPK